MSVPSPVQQELLRLEQRDLPIVKTFIAWITESLHRQLEEIASYAYLSFLSGYFGPPRQVFQVEFLDGTRYDESFLLSDVLQGKLGREEQ